MIEFRNVSKEFESKDKKVQALKNVTLEIEEGDIYGIIGFSGAGKSTLLRVINALEKPTAGEVLIGGEDINKLSAKALRAKRKQIGMIFQQFHLLETRTVYENVALPLKLNKVPKGQIRRKVEEILEFVELSDKRDVYPSKLSGGQKQRVGIARALATEPSILLSDEATSALDPKTTTAILQLLKKINRKLHITIVLITHEMNVIQGICNHVAVMENGEIVERGNVIEVFSEPKEIITKNFVRTVIPDSVPEKLVRSIRGDRRNYKILRLKFLDSDSTESVLAAVNKRYDVETNILFANISEIQDSILGSGHLVALSKISTVPASVFSEKHDSIDEIGDGMVVAVPQDAGNQARAYVMLQDIGWITLKEGTDYATASTEDVGQNSYNLQFYELQTSYIATSLSDFDYGIITGSIVYNAGIDPSTALFNENLTDSFWLQVVVDGKNKDTQWAKDVVAAYQSEEFLTWLEENNEPKYNGLWSIPKY